MKVFVFDAERCNGCHNCQVACKDEHVGNAWPPYAAPEPNTGQFWLRVLQREHGQIPMVKVEYTAWLCMHCERCVAAEACGSDAFVRRDDGLVYIDPARCTGCMDCVPACPYEAVFANEAAGIAQKCTGCAHLVDEGRLPHCVDLCATGGLRFGDAEDFACELADAEVMRGELGTGPRVYYRNLPHLFLGGEVWDPQADEVIEGARVTLAAVGGVEAAQETDDFGDFKFERLDPGEYRLAIEAPGFKPVARDVVLEESTYLGDFPLERA